MRIKPIQAKIVAGIVVVAGIAMIIANINGIKISADTVVPTTGCTPDQVINLRSYFGFNFGFKTNTITKKYACITDISPSSFKVGQTFTITGNNFSTERNNFILIPANDTNNRWRFIRGSVKSTDGTSLQLTLPNDVFASCNTIWAKKMCSKLLKPGQYQIQIDPAGSNMHKSNFYSITILDEKTQPTNDTNITLVPTSGVIGAGITITAENDYNFTPTGNAVNLDGSKNSIINLNSTDGKTLMFNFPDYTGSLNGVDAHRPTYFPIQPGVHTISITNSDNKTTNDINFTVDTPKPDETPSISGQIKDWDESGLSYAFVRVSSDDAGIPDDDWITDWNGNYKITGLPANANYKLTIPGHICNPEVRSLKIADKSVTNQDFLCDQVHAISNPTTGGNQPAKTNTK